MIRKIRGLLYDQGFTISGARHKLQEMVQVDRDLSRTIGVNDPLLEDSGAVDACGASSGATDASHWQGLPSDFSIQQELLQIRELLTVNGPQNPAII